MERDQARSPRPVPPADVDVDVALVRRLLASQHPDLVARPLALLASGWDNVVFRLGEDLVVRLPRRAPAARLIEHEQRWLPGLAPGLPLAVPAPVRVGLPGEGYPYRWSVCPWLPGEMATLHPPTDWQATINGMTAFVRALHRPAPHDAPANPFRGIPLAERGPTLHDHLALLAALVDRDTVLDLWARLVAVPTWRGPAVWLHGDLHPANILVARGTVVAVIDFGDLTGGDPATDLAVAWMLFPAEHRGAFQAALPEVDGPTWARARGWALVHALACLAGSADNPMIHAMGEHTLAAVLADG